MKAQISILAIILTISTAFGQDRTRTRTSSSNSNRTERVQSHTSKGTSISATNNRTRSAAASSKTTRQRSSDAPRYSSERTRRTSPGKVPTQHTVNRTRSTSAHSNNAHHYNRPYKKAHSHHNNSIRTHVRFTPTVRTRYVNLYPHIDFSIYPVGYNLPYISAYKARYYKGQLATVYGYVQDISYSREYDEYYLYVGQSYPRHDFSVVVPGHIARNYSRHPVSYFMNEEIYITGYIDTYRGKPEMIVKGNSQFYLY